MTHGVKNNLIQVTGSDNIASNLLYNAIERDKHSVTNVIFELSHNLLREDYFNIVFLLTNFARVINNQLSIVRDSYICINILRQQSANNISLYTVVIRLLPS